jgi:hypothetical protein
MSAAIGCPRQAGSQSIPVSWADRQAQPRRSPGAGAELDRAVSGDRQVRPYALPECDAALLEIDGAVDQSDQRTGVTAGLFRPSRRCTPGAVLLSLEELSQEPSSTSYIRSATRPCASR